MSRSPIPSLGFRLADLPPCDQEGEGEGARGDGKQLSITHLLTPLDRRQLLARAAEGRREQGAREEGEDGESL